MEGVSFLVASFIKPHFKKHKNEDRDTAKNNKRALLRVSVKQRKPRGESRHGEYQFLKPEPWQSHRVDLGLSDFVSTSSVTTGELEDRDQPDDVAQQEQFHTHQ
jgi:hypothetical protein